MEREYIGYGLVDFHPAAASFADPTTNRHDSITGVDELMRLHSELSPHLVPFGEHGPNALYPGVGFRIDGPSRFQASINRRTTSMFSADIARPVSRSVYAAPMASAELSRHVDKIVGYPPPCDMGAAQRREFHEALLHANTLEDLPGSGRRRSSGRSRTGRRYASSGAIDAHMWQPHIQRA
jgi:hypothetical protein